ncbi:hypothetical protein BFP76_01850 [Amylibacter kogurei]|uniref:Cell envelope biogenesis protein TolA n=1 Tax=Paramylibacter kogurei TaxID=1889778 RepID=A0A2G5K4I5_9RHOB|nr:hypothetical protein [Amylibacter kogurei]PIB24019.1 hypothetical protein BFP76_01850 [Amylibacter kogurei]
MDTGIKISASAHAALIAAAIFSGQLFRAAPEDTVAVAQVSLISGDELDAMTIQTVDETNIDEPTPSITQPSEPAVVEPEVAEPESSPPEVEEPAPVGEVETTDVGTDAIIEQAGEVKDEEFAMAAPKQADIVTDQVTEKPEDIAKPVEQAIPSVTPKEKPKDLVEPKEEATPKETTTKVVTEADELNQNDPMKTVRPKGRPQQLAKLEEPAEEKPEPKPAPKPETQPDPTPAIDPLEQAILDDLKAEEAKRTAAAETGVANATAGESNVRKGSPLSQSEKDGLIFAIKECWNVPFGIENAEELAVTVGFELHPDGRLKGQINFLSEGDENSGLTAVAYRAARSAIVRCLPYDKLPQEKYDSWKKVEVTFDPKKMVLR